MRAIQAMRDLFTVGTVVWLLVIGPLMLLAGCAPGPHVRVDNPKPVEVPVVVAATCIKPADVPAMPPRVGDQLTGDARHDLDVVAEALIRTRAVLDVAIARLKGCAG